ncbi:MAG: MaoC/PaaZ C-terminal domain-containing protein [Actinomycetota bacterium]
MAIPTDLVGTGVAPMEHRVDERWTMAYAASLGDTASCYLDTTAPGGVVAHPVFAVCPEWPVIVAGREDMESRGVPLAEVRTGVHATHDTVIHRLVRPGDVLRTSMETVAMMNINPGAMSTIRLRTVDQDDRPVATTSQNAIYLGIPADGPDRPDPEPPGAIDGADRIGDPDEAPVRIDAGAAHTYTECARIWNPIHTDQAVALAAGLPGLILHGTANLAHGVSAVVAHRADGRPELVRRIAGRFAAMVLMPSQLTVRIWQANETADGRRTVPFEVLNQDGQPAVKDGLVVLGPEEG